MVEKVRSRAGGEGARAISSRSMRFSAGTMRESGRHHRSLGGRPAGSKNDQARRGASVERPSFLFFHQGFGGSLVLP